MKAQGWGHCGQCNTLVLSEVAGEAAKPELVTKGYLQGNEKLYWEVEVQNWMEALILYNEYQNWQPYSPMKEDWDEYEATLKRLGRDQNPEYQKILKKEKIL